MDRGRQAGEGYSFATICTSLRGGFSEESQDFDHVGVCGHVVDVDAGLWG